MYSVGEKVENKTLTIFTPTYNRAATLPRVYQSLLNQSNYDFEWLIIDDGSSDDTESVVKGFDQSRFDIVYHKQTNGGKHRAYNCALEMARGAYFFCLDSDDWLEEGAIQGIVTKICPTGAKFVLAYKKDQTGKMLSDRFPENTQQVDLFDLGRQYHCNGEFSIIFRTDFAKNHPFPTFEGERFMTEAVVYDRLAMLEKVVLFPQVITICEYQEDGLSNNLNRTMKSNPAGYCLYFMQRIDFQTSLFQQILCAGKYQCFAVFSGKHKTKYTGKHKMLVICCKPVGWLFVWYYKLFRGF